MRILNGISPVSLQSTRDLTNELNKLGRNAESIVYKPNPLLNKLEDRSLDINLKKYWMYPVYVYRVLKFFIQSVYKYDVFHFHFAHSLLPLNIDLPILRLFGKKIFMEYHGSDIRYKINVIKDGQILKTTCEKQKSKSIKRQKRISRFVNGIFVHDNELKSNLINNSAQVNLLPLRVDLSRFNIIENNINERLVIVHAPSKRSIKGSDYIEEIVKEIMSCYDIEYIMINNMDYNEAIEIYKKADIIIDQMVIGAYGMLSIEGMALGKCVVCYIEDDDLVNNSANKPLCNTNISNLKNCLIELIENPELRSLYGINGRKFVELYHSSDKVAEQALKYYNN